MPGTYLVDENGDAIEIARLTGGGICKRGDYSTQQTNTALWTPATGKRFVLTDIVVSSDAEGTITLLDNTTVIRKYYLGANGGVVENMMSDEESAAVDSVLKVTTSAAIACYVVVKGYEK